MKRAFVHLLALFLFFACNKTPGGWKITELQPPAMKESGEPNVRAYGTRVYLNWFQRNSDGSLDLLFSQWNGQFWTDPFQIARSSAFVVNWADFPSLVALESGMLVAQWSQKAPGGSLAANVQVATSNNDGHTWSAALSPHKEQANFEHGFVALSDLNMGRFAAFWLDGRKFTTPLENASMMLLYSEYEGGRFTAERVIDDRVCDCCQTDAAPIPGGLIVVYRDRSADEIRDVHYLRNVNGAWTKSQAIWNDGWKIQACPVNGPAIATDRKNVAVVWFTAAGNQPRVQIVFSADGGETFGKPMRVDNGNPAGRVDVEWLQNHTAMITWLENNGEIRARVVRSDGTGEESLIVAKSSSAHASGFPRLARFGNGALVTWTALDGNHTRVKVASLAR